MPVVLVVSSEEQLRYGFNWCQRIASRMSLDVQIVIVGEDRKVLLTHAEKVVRTAAADSTSKVFTSTVPAETESVLQLVRSSDASLLVMVHATDVSSFQRSLFEQSPVQTLWLRTKNEPPDSAERIFKAVKNPLPVASLACEKMLGLIPQTVMASVTDTSDQIRDDVIAEIEHRDLNADDFIWFGIQHPHRGDQVYLAALALLDSSTSVSIALVRNGEPITDSLASRIQNWAAKVAPPMQRDKRRELAASLEEGSKPNIEFLGLMSAASMLAAFGLLQDSAAVIIGAMLIAPLMTPILGAGLAIAQGNQPLFRSALLTITIGFIGAVVSSMMFGWLVSMFQQPDITPEMWARCRPSPLDFCVGLVGGTAAAYARTRSHLSSALAGAAIAAALVPPISTAGLQIAFGKLGANDKGVAVTGPLLLVTVNVLTIMIGSSFVLWSRGMRSDKNRAVRDRWGPRMMILLMILAAVLMMKLVGSETIFPKLAMSINEFSG